ncbi:putative glutamate carboxypeptidase [Lachnellula suecica]|uniref:Putative glutamate carboxypeptidase n=1 Tax=Lachnellula suecica TaxID=602035 RepID=A0A8T9CCU8_9HELO|nr:putative glutamate carboxypeptidase [Lachnellula suecica]
MSGLLDFQHSDHILSTHSIKTESKNDWPERVCGTKDRASGQKLIRRRQARGQALMFVGIALLALLILASYPACGVLCNLGFQFRTTFFPGHQPHNVPFEELKNILQTEPSSLRLSEWSHYYTSTPHFAGEGLEQAIWTTNRWEEFGVPETWITSYELYFGTPIRQRLALLEALDDTGHATKLLYEAGLTEEVPPDDPSEARRPAFHSRSFSGNITAQFVYANFGLSQDYDDLDEANVDLEGKIAVVKSGGDPRWTKMKNAVRKGIVGLVIYTDPQQGGNITEAHGYKPYPDGPALPSTYIELGTIALQAVTSDGSNPSVPGESIPSIPVSYEDIIPILKALNGHGPKAVEMNNRWLGGGLGYKGVDYYVGPSPSAILLNLNNQMDYEKKKIHIAFGRINGSVEDETIILGNHRDAWSAGASDSASGSAALMEVARSFGIARSAGWKPRRTLIFASWDGEEVGLVSSLAWARENLAWLSENVVAYLDVVVAASGKSFSAKASPLLRQVLREATKMVPAPGRNDQGQAVFDQWDGDISSPGGGSVPSFIQPACISPTYMGFRPGPQDPPFPYHSNLDTFTWMNTTGDPDWSHHLAVTRIWTLLAGHLADSPVLKFNATSYALFLKDSVEIATEKLPNSTDFDLGPLEQTVAEFHSACETFDYYAASLEAVWDEANLSRDTRWVNKRYKLLERQFCYHGAQEDRSQSEHVVFGDSENTPYYIDGNALPRLLNNIESGNWSNALKWRDIIQSKIEDATHFLKL